MTCTGSDVPVDSATHGPTFVLDGANVQDVVRYLREQHGLPICFIDIGHTTGSATDYEANTLEELLSRVCSRNPEYRYRIEGERSLLFPENEGWELNVEIGTTRGPRLDVASRFLEELRADERFGDLLPPPIKGDPNAEIYTDEVAMRASDSALGHLSALLGHDATLVFSIEATASEERVLLFRRVRPKH